MTLTSNDAGKIVSFNIYPSSIIGNKYNRVKIKGVIDSSSVTTFEPVSMHANVYPTLPTGVPDDYDGYMYLKVELQNGNIDYVGLPWIIESSIITHEDVEITVVFKGVTSADYQKIRNMCLNNNYTDFDIT